MTPEEVHLYVCSGCGTVYARRTDYSPSPMPKIGQCTHCAHAMLLPLAIDFVQRIFMIVRP
jgi:predicted SprT family Zn-dependent metalloprotease